MRKYIITVGDESSQEHEEYRGEPAVFHCYYIQNDTEHIAKPMRPSSVEKHTRSSFVNVCMADMLNFNRSQVHVRYETVLQEPRLSTRREYKLRN